LVIFIFGLFFLHIRTWSIKQSLEVSLSLLACRRTDLLKWDLKSIFTKNRWFCKALANVRNPCTPSSILSTVTFSPFCALNRQNFPVPLLTIWWPFSVTR
jgi:hypothetical protein